MKADAQIAVRWKTQADEVKAVPVAVILIVVVILQNVAAVATPVLLGAVAVQALFETVAVQALLEATVALQALSGAVAVPIVAMSPMDRQKDVLLQEAREAVVALPVHQKEATVQEDDNLFLY